MQELRQVIAQRDRVRPHAVDEAGITAAQEVQPDDVQAWHPRRATVVADLAARVEDRHLTTREAVDAFKAEHDVATTPQVFIDGARIGGHDDLRRFLGKRVADPKATTYRPVIALFAMTAAMAMAASYAVSGEALTMRAAEWFIGMSMVVLALLKLQNVETFATMFLNYDLLAKRWVPYSYIYPFAEGLAGAGGEELLGRTLVFAKFYEARAKSPLPLGEG